MSHLNEIVSILQTSIGPTILISGVGLLLLTMVNRLNHLMDRARHLCAIQNKTLSNSIQLVILWKRAKLIRAAILFSSLCALLDAALMINIFVSSILDLLQSNSWSIGMLFVGILLSLITSLIFFIMDIGASLKALQVEIDIKQ